MATITEDYVSFEIAKLLKEKGFDGRCTHYYKNEKYLVDLGYTNIHSYTNSDLVEELTAPTLQMAMKWLREVHNCPIEILWHWNTDSQCSEWYFMHHMELKPLPQIQYYDTYEQACEAAIKYCLEHLI